MAATYAPGTHTTPTTAAIGTSNIVGLSPGRVFAEISDGLAATYVWLPTAQTSDGFPGTMVPFATGTGAVT